ncbi:MAG: COG4315 family predicted lipoprotein [Streptosporangiaceae bacterium]
MIWNADVAAAKVDSGALRTQKRWRAVIPGLTSVALAALIAACGSAGAYGGQPQQPGNGHQPAVSHGSAVSVHKLPGVGMVLVDGSGKTVYSPQQEAHGKILCTGACLSFWFPVTVAAGTQPHDAPGMAGTLGTIRRSDDGKSQLTYNGRPLYTFRLDQGPGELHGNNFSDQFAGTSFTWHVVAASGAAPASAQSAKPGSGYSYPAGGSYGN